MGTRDRVRLSVQERKELATIEAMVEAGDPELATALSSSLRPWQRAWRRLQPPVVALRGALVVRAGRKFGRGVRRACLLVVRSLPARLKRVWLEAKWPGPVLVALGLGLVFGTISVATWLSVLGVVVIAAGLGMWLLAWRKALPPKPAPRSHEAPTS